MGIQLLRFRRDERGLSGVEFALISPILITLILGSYEIQRYVRIDRQLGATAETVAELMAQEEGPLEPTTPSMNFDVAIHMFPEASRDSSLNWYDVLVHQFSHVVFKASPPDCTVDCTFTADMAWIWPPYETGKGWGSLRARCGPVLIADTDNAGIPKALAGHGSMTIVDLKYEFKPSFGSNFISPITMIKRGFAATQFASPYIKFPPYTTGWRNLQNTVCPGYE